MDANGKTPVETEHKCMGIVQEAQERREKRRDKPQPWIVRKLAIFMTIAIIVYAWYVYVGRLCVPMIRRDTNALGSRGMGIAFLVVFCIIGLITIWSYEKIVLTSPGLAKDHVKKSPAPVRKALPTWWDTESEADLAAARFQASLNPPQPQPQPQPQVETRHRLSESRHKRSMSGTGSETVSDRDGDAPASSGRNAFQNGHASPLTPPGEENVGITDVFPPVAAARAKATATRGPTVRPELEAQPEPESLPGTASARNPMMYTRSPSKTPILLPEYRYCNRDGFLKPHRAHHCRACGTCVLKYDHHCPWIGQCVGARNHRFFLIFVFWAFLFGTWVFSTLVGLNARAAVQHRPNFIDGQKIAIIVLSGFFTIFTMALLVTHTILLTDNMSTVEQMNVQRMREREKRVLLRLHARWQLSARGTTRREWDAEWGRIGKEGHIWWLGSSRKNWEAAMGDRVWMWFLPIGQSPDDGLSYVPNPRFDSEGRWRPRSEWPAELR